MHLAVAGFGMLYLLSAVKPFEWGKNVRVQCNLKFLLHAKMHMTYALQWAIPIMANMLEKVRLSVWVGPDERLQKVLFNLRRKDYLTKAACFLSEAFGSRAQCKCNTFAHIYFSFWYFLLLAKRFNQLNARQTYNYISLHSGHILPIF